MEVAKQETNKKKINTSILILQVIGIIAVVLGHADSGAVKIPNFINMAFPYYSWHMPFFIFISGYLFNRTLSSFEYISKKIKTHLIPALIVNAVHGVFSMTIKFYNLTNFGRDITLKALFVEPFTTGYQFYINVSLWFIFSLFVIEVISCIMDRVVKGKGDLIYLIITLAIAIYCTYFCFYNPEAIKNEYFNALLRQGFLLFFFWLGVCYKKYFEEFFKKILSYKTSIIIFIIQAVCLHYTDYTITINTRNMIINTITVPNGFWIAIISPITATLFFLGLAYSLAPYLEDNKLLHTIGRNTKYIVYNHQLILCLSSISLAALINKGYFTFIEYDFKQMRWNNYYTSNNLIFTTIVTILAFFIPLIIGCYLKDKKLPTKIIGYTILSILVLFILYFSSLAYI